MMWKCVDVCPHFTSVFVAHVFVSIQSISFTLSATCEMGVPCQSSSFCCTLGCIWRVSQTPLTNGVHDNGRPRRVPLEDVMRILKPYASSIDGRPGRLPKAYWQVAKGVLAFPANCAICITNDGLISFFSRSCYCCRRHCYCWLCPLPVGLPKTEPPSYSPLPLTLPPYAPVPFLRTFVGRCGGVRSFVCQEAPPGGRSTLYNKRR